MSEINLPLAELEDTIHHLRQWMAPQWVPSNLAGMCVTGTSVMFQLFQQNLQFTVTQEGRY